MTKRFAFLLTLLPILALSQTVKLGTAYTLDIESVSLMKVVKSKSGYYAAKKGETYLVIEGTIYSSIKKTIELPLHRLFLKTETDSYMGLADPSYIPFSDLDRFLRFKKKTKRPIYFIVDETFKEGTIVFDYEGILTLKTQEDGLNVDFTPYVVKD